MSTPAPKRRRIDDAQTALRKPFKSPFRTPLKAGQEAKPSHTAILASKLSQTAPATPDATPTSEILPSARVRHGEEGNANGEPTPPTTPVPSQTLDANHGTGHENRGNGTKDEESHVSKSFDRKCIRGPRGSLNSLSLSNSTRRTNNPSTARQLLTLRTDIQTLRQAHTLATTSTDEDLEALVEKWKGAARAAAEEVFAGSRDRVNRMGGVGAWREREREQVERRREWDREEREAEWERMKSDREEAGEGEAGYEGDVEVDTDARAEGEGQGGEEKEEGADDESFTMGMMLRTLNIDLDVIGYDKVNQRWVS